MNDHVISEIGRIAAERRANVGKIPEHLPHPARSFFIFDPEWARLKRKYLLKDNFYRLWEEAKLYAPEPLKMDIRQAYRSFKIWEKNFNTWVDVAFGEFPEQLYKQMVEYSRLRQELLKHMHKQGIVSNTIPGTRLARTPPQQLSQVLPKVLPEVGNKAFLLLAGLGLFWIWSNRRRKNGRD